MPSTALTMPSSVSKCTCRLSISRSAISAPLVADARVEECVQDVHEQVHHDDGERRDQHGPLHDRQVALLDRVEGQAPDPRDVEDGLREDGAAEQDAEIEAEDGDDRGDRRAQPMAEDYPALPESLGAGRTDVVLAHH